MPLPKRRMAIGRSEAHGVHHCSVGCAIDAVVENGVWVHQEPVFDSPIKPRRALRQGRGGARARHDEHSHRLKYPMKLVNGKYQKISWTSDHEIGDRMMALRKESGPDALYFVGSSKHNNEQAYLMRKWVSLWGTNNCDHQARSATRPPWRASRTPGVTVR